jgi:hypothetical protein
MKKLGNLMLLGLLTLLFSCQKESNDPKSPISGNLNDINVSPTLNWNTSKTIDVYITGQPTENPVISTLILSLKDGSNLYQASQDMSQSVVIKIIVPTVEDQIKLNYGSKEYTLTIVNNKVDFSFLLTAQP